MTRFSFFSFFFIFAAITLLWTACNKDRGLSDGFLTQSYATDRNSDYTQAELDEIAQAIADIQAFKAQIDRWRDGQELSQTIAADEAAEKVEVAINFYLSKPGLSFAEYTAVFDSVSVSATGATWTGADVAALYNAMKARLSVHFDAVSGTDKAYQFVDMGLPVVRDGVSKVYFVANIGKQIATDLTMPSSNEEETSACECLFNDGRWAQVDPILGQPHTGFTVTNCFLTEPDAATWIGKWANFKIGFNLSNLPPAPFDLNNPLPPNVLIFSSIDVVQTNFYGSKYPLGVNVPDPLFLVSTYYRTPQWAFPFLDNPVTACNSFPDYKRFGQYAIHADFATGTDLPDESCFCLDKFNYYIDRNIDAGQFYSSRVNQILFPDSTPSFLKRRRLLSTVVKAHAGTFVTLDDGLLRCQEHPTFHFYAAVLKLAFDNPALVCCPSEL